MISFLLEKRYLIVRDISTRKYHAGFRTSRKQPTCAWFTKSTNGLASHDLDDEVGSALDSDTSGLRTISTLNDVPADTARISTPHKDSGTWWGVVGG